MRLLIVAALALACSCEPRQIPDNDPALPVKPELVGAAYSTKVYRFTDSGAVCFIAVERSSAGVAISCVKGGP